MPPTPPKVSPAPSECPGEGSGPSPQVAEAPSLAPTLPPGLAPSCAQLRFQGCSVKERVCGVGGTWEERAWVTGPFGDTRLAQPRKASEPQRL